MTQPIDRAFVEVVPDTSNFARDLDRELDAALRDLELSVKRAVATIENDFRDAGDAIGDQIRRGVNEAQLALSRLETTEITITANVELDDQWARNQLFLLSQETITIKAEIDIDVDTTLIQTKLQASLNRIARRRAVVKISIDIDIQDALRQLRYLQRIVDQTFRLNIKVRIDTTQLLAQLAIIQGVIDQSLDIDIDQDVGNATRGLSRLQRMLALVATAIAAVAVLLPELAALVPITVSAVNAIASLAGLLIGIPAAISLAVVGIGSLIIATKGMSEAFGAAVSGDMEALDEALKKLAPSAREVVLAVSDLSPVLRELQQSLQQRLFEDLANDLAFLGERILPAASFGMENFVTAINHGLQETLAFLGTRQALRDIETIFFNIGEAGKQLAGLIPSVTSAFVNLSAVGSEFLQPIAAELDNIVDRFAEWIDESRRSGELTKAFQTALNTLKTLSQAVLDVGIGIKNIFQLGPDGQLFLNTISKIAKSFRDWTESVEGATAIKGFFTTINQAAARSSGLFEVLGRNIIDSLLPALNDLGAGLGPGVVTLIESLGDAIDNLRPALEPVGRAISTVVDALSPLLVGLGETLGNMLPAVADALTVVAEAARPFIAAFARLASGLSERLGPAISDVVEQLGPFLSDISEAVGPKLDELVDKLLELSEIVLDQITGENLEKIVAALEKMTPAVIDALISLVDALINFIDKVGPQLPGLTEDFTGMAVAFAQLATSGLQLAAVVLPALGTIIGAIGALLISFQGAIFGVQNAFFTIINGIIEQVQKFPGWIAEVVPQIIESWLEVSTTFTEVGFQIIASVLGWLFRTQTDIAAWIGNVLVSIGGFVVDVLTFFYDLGFSIGETLGDALNTAQDIVSDGLNTIIGFFADLPGEVRDAISGLVGVVSDAINDASGEGQDAAENAVSTIVSIFAGLPGAIFDAVTGIDLFSAGSQIGESFADGIRSAVGSVIDAVSGLAGIVPDYLQGRSPTKKGPLSGSGWTEFSGIAVARAFAEGIKSQVREVQSAANSLASAVAIPMANPIGTTFGNGTTASNLINNVDRRGGFLPVGTGATAQRSESVVINNNMTVNTPTENPEIIAEMILNRVARKVRVR